MTQPGRQQPQLEENLVFSEAFDSDAAWELANNVAQPSLSAYDHAGRLYVWNPEGGVLHYVSVDRDAGSGSLATLQSSSHDSPFDTLVPTTALDFPIVSITVSRSGRYVALVGESALAVLDAQSSKGTDSPEVASCSVHSIAGAIFPGGEAGPALLRVAWHPSSDTHLGILSSDGVFRLFDLSQDKDSPEQEYYLQRAHAPPRGFARPVDLVFGGEHLWEKFTVFFLWSDGAILPLCPVVPFGSLFSHESILSLVRDMEQCASQGTPFTEATLAWLHETFPLSERRATSASPARSEAVRAATGMVIAARAHVPYECSPALQGPLPLVGPGAPPLRKGVSAAHLVCSPSGKDCLLAWSQTDGLVHVSVLTEEVLPAWSYDHVPQTSHDPDGRLTRATMVAQATDVAAPDPPSAPPLLLLASADLALSADVRFRAPLSLTADPLVPERIFCRHGRGVDSITLRWLPFSDLAGGDRDLAKIPPPDVYSLLDVSGGDEQEARPLMGLAVVSDSAGETWLVASPVGGDCVVISVRSETPAMLPALLLPGPEGEGAETPAISPELLQGPKKGLIPKAPRGPPVAASSHEGRLLLHARAKALREVYIEYAHRAHVELTARVARLAEIAQEQRAQATRAQRGLEKAATTADGFEGRLAAALAKHAELERRLQRYSKLPIVSRTPLTAAERAYRSELVGLEADLPLLGGTLAELAERAQKLARARGAGPAGPHRTPPVPDAQMHRLKQAVERSTGVITGMMDKVHLLEESVHRKERHVLR
ncbi:hypothetical protein KFL_002710110 [Klebsormidium nitens]|uniref:Nuclear pore complex protein Nup88 n=1 Tax=Klebsormidium nitens TaxID=105231 RepID=A0A1Y1IBN0_KLENI|nr:hypothetical protein KFL_002710110 [Klebsormidium nitens]|eukprot:GAQ86116.1 hypothetical protein KFL_002710110 [Klebsormidium nitens]